jgi:hypothetical protein
MPRADAMTYVASRKRWTKMYKGQRFWISCQALGAPETKDGSRQAANAWWTDKENQLRGVHNMGSPEYRLALLNAFAGHPVSEQEQPAQTAAFLHTVAHMPIANASNLMRGFLGEQGLTQAAQLQTTYKQQIDGLLNNLPVMQDTVQAHVESWLALELLRVNNGKLSPGSYDNYKRDVKGFMEFVGEYTSAKTINEDTVKGFFADLQNKSNRVAKWTVGKAFVRHLAEQRTIELPGNLDSRKFRFGKSEPKQQTWSMAQWESAYKTSEGLNRLCLLLAANCGYYGADIASAYAHFNASNGTITMKRVKTEARTVTWVLWQETAALMVKHGNELSGLWGKTLDENGKQRKRVASCIRGLKQLRHTSITMLHHSPLQAYENYFAGHAQSVVSGESVPLTMTEKHYAADSLETSKRLSDYLHQQYFGQ